MSESFSLDEKFISKIFERYLKTKLLLQKISDSKNLQEKGTQYGSLIEEGSQLIEYQKFLQLIETILALLPKSEYTCLIKDFLYVDQNKLWWKKSYSSDSYQKLKNKAISHFLYLFLI